MRRDSRILFLLLIQAGISLQTFSQSDRFAYAVTDQTRNGSAWTVLRRVDLRSGQFSNVLLDGANTRTALYQTGSLDLFRSSTYDTSKLFRPEVAFGSGVAAIAYDRKNDRLFYTPMYVDQLRYVDMATQKVYCVGTSGFFGASGAKADGMTTLSRMVIAGDGNGYTLSNDGEHLYRFTTTGTPTIRDLGALTDAAINTNQSIKSFCANAGGDMVSDNGGNLYLVTATNNVFRISIQDRIATFLGRVKGLPDKFTTNGAAVDEEGRVLLSSSTYDGSWYTVDPLTWTATVFKAPDGTYHSADLANSNVLFAGPPSNQPAQAALNVSGSAMIKLYPNPVENNQFTIRFTNLEPGNYTLQLTDQLGRQLLEKKVSILSSSHSENVRLQNDMAKGIYMVKVTNQKDMQVFVEKLMVTKIK
jgi:hypothetical protein